MKDISTKFNNTPGPDGQLTAEDFNDHTEELENAVTGSAQVLTVGAGVDTTQLAKGMANHAVTGSGKYVESGVADAYVVDNAVGFQGPSAVITGTEVTFIAGNTNGGPSTLDYNGEGPVPVTDPSGGGLSGGEIVAGERTKVYRNGGQWRLTTSTTVVPPATIAVPENTKIGFNINVNTLAFQFSRTGNNKIVDSTRSVIIEDTTIGVNFSKRIDLGLWTEGANNAGLGVAWLSASLHRVFVIMKANGTVDLGTDTDVNAANLMALAGPSGYIYHRQIGWAHSHSFGGGPAAEALPATELANNRVVYVSDTLGADFVNHVINPVNFQGFFNVACPPNLMAFGVSSLWDAAVGIGGPGSQVTILSPASFAYPGGINVGRTAGTAGFGTSDDPSRGFAGGHWEACADGTPRLEYVLSGNSGPTELQVRELGYYQDFNQY